MPIIHLIKYKIQSLLRNNFPFYLNIQALRRKTKKLVTKSDTEIVIEGYPRSANTFSVMAFTYAQRINNKKVVKKANHLHSYMQIKKAVHYGIPCMVLIRDPKDAVLSNVMRHQWLPLKWALIDYRNFYKNIEKYKGSIFIARFEDIISDFGLVTRNFNEAFNTSFSEFDHSKENVKYLLERINKHDEIIKGDNILMYSTPTKEKEDYKKELLIELAKLSNEKLLNNCYKIYFDLIN